MLELRNQKKNGWNWWRGKLGGFNVSAAHFLEDFLYCYWLVISLELIFPDRLRLCNWALFPCSDRGLLSSWQLHVFTVPSFSVSRRHSIFISFHLKIWSYLLLRPPCDWLTGLSPCFPIGRESMCPACCPSSDRWPTSTSSGWWRTFRAKRK